MNKKEGLCTTVVSKGYLAGLKAQFGRAMRKTPLIPNSKDTPAIASSPFANADSITWWRVVGRHWS
jgi:hypothetical protein